MQIAVAFSTGAENGGGAAAGGRFQRERNELIKDLLAGMQGGNPGRCRRSQRNPAPTHLGDSPLTTRNPVHSSEQGRYHSVAWLSYRHLLQGVGVGAAAGKGR